MLAINSVELQGDHIQGTPPQYIRKIFFHVNNKFYSVWAREWKLAKNRGGRLEQITRTSLSLRGVWFDLVNFSRCAIKYLDTWIEY